MTSFLLDVLVALLRAILPNVEFRFPPALARLIALACGIGATVACVTVLGFMRHVPSTEGSPAGLIIVVMEGSAALVLGCVALWSLYFALVGPSDD